MIIILNLTLSICNEFFRDIKPSDIFDKRNIKDILLDPNNLEALFSYVSYFLVYFINQAKLFFDLIFINLDCFNSVKSHYCKIYHTFYFLYFLFFIIFEYSWTYYLGEKAENDRTICKKVHNQTSHKVYFILNVLI